jgi:DNA-binding MarR family transcriptional regulator
LIDKQLEFTLAKVQNLRKGNPYYEFKKIIPPMEQAKKLAELAPKIMNAFHDLGRQHPSGEKLSMRQFQALIILKASASLTLSQLCNKLSLAASTGTELVNRMIDLGHIQKAHEQKDQRQVMLTVTPKGHELLKQRQQALAEMFTNFLSKFPVEEQKNFVCCFEKIWEFMQKYHLKS